MWLRERIVFATALVVLLTVGVVGGTEAVWEGPGEPAAVAVAVAVTFGLSLLVTRSVVHRALKGQVDQMALEVRSAALPSGEVEVDPDLAALHNALRARVEQLEARSEELQREARAATQVLETSSFGTCLLDPEGRITFANPKFRSLFKLRGEPVGRRPIEVVPVVEIHEVVEEAMAGRAAEKAFVTASQDLVARAQPLTEDRAIVRVEDVTHIREAERARTDFVANVSHELRTPVAAIMGYLETLLQEGDRLPDDLFPLLETVERNARRLRDLFEDLLRLHRIEARRRELPLQQLPLLKLLEQAVGPTRDRAKMRNQDLVLRCAPELEGLVNPEAFTAIIANLASNASNYSTDGGRIEVRAARDNGEVRVDVQDDGIGIAERHQERIFERFYRVDEARSRRIGGTGLGLAIVKHYALASRCNVTLKSKEGEGSTFSVHLPPH